MKILKFLIVFVAVLSITFSVPAVVRAAPAVPYPSSPVNGGLFYLNGGFATFTWSNTVVPGFGYYDIEVSTDPTFTDISKILWSSDGNHAVGGGCSLLAATPFWTNVTALQPMTTYYFRIQAYDLTCNHDYSTGGSGWGVYDFYTAIAAPSYVKPLSGTLSNNLDNFEPSGYMFQWTSVSGASGYILEVSTSPTFSSTYLDVTVPYSNTFNGGADVGYALSSDLPSNTVMYWRVETLNTTYGPSIWANTPGACSPGYCTFTTANVSASPVAAPGYTKNKVTNDFTPGIFWNAIALPGGATFTTYEVQVSTDKTFYDLNQQCFDVWSTQVPSLQYQYSNGDPAHNNDPSLTIAQLDTQLALNAPGNHYHAGCPVQSILPGPITAFAPTTQYYWRVLAEEGTVFTSWSDVYAFRTSYLRVDSATFVASRDTVNKTVTFSWSKPTGESQDPYNYLIQICSDSGFNDCVKADAQATTPYTWYLKSYDPPGVLYYWRVQGRGPWGPGQFSDTATVTTP